MGWLAAVFVLGLFCSVLSTETKYVDTGLPHLEIKAIKMQVWEVGARKAIYCDGYHMEEPIKWYSPSGSLVKPKSASNTRVYVERKIEGAKTTLILLLHNVQINDTGKWTCISGSLTASFPASIGIKAILNVTDAIVEGDERHAAKLQCIVNGHPLPTVQWYKDNAPIDAKNSRKYVIRKFKEDRYSLEIKNLTYEDAGIYFCKVTQDLFTDYQTASFELRVRHAPILQTYQTVEVYAAMNTTKEINCSAIAHPKPRYTWARREDNYDTKFSEEDGIENAEDGSYSILKLRINSESDIGEYKCTVVNSKGSQIVIFDVSLGERPPAPDKASAVAANASHITFEVECSACIWANESIPENPQNLSVIGFDFSLTKFKQGYLPDWDKAETFYLDAPGEFAVGPLDNTTEFHARVRSRNEAGVSDWVNVIGNPSTTSQGILFAYNVALIGFSLLVAL